MKCNLPLIALMFVLVPLGFQALEVPVVHAKILHAVVALFTIHVSFCQAIGGALAAMSLLIVVAAFAWESK